VLDSDHMTFLMSAPPDIAFQVWEYYRSLLRERQAGAPSVAQPFAGVRPAASSALQARQGRRKDTDDESDDEPRDEGEAESEAQSSQRSLQLSDIKNDIMHFYKYIAFYCFAGVTKHASELMDDIVKVSLQRCSDGFEDFTTEEVTPLAAEIEEWAG
jgi:hypothetical protein